MSLIFLFSERVTFVFHSLYFSPHSVYVFYLPIIQQRSDCVEKSGKYFKKLSIFLAKRWNFSWNKKFYPLNNKEITNFF